MFSKQSVVEASASVSVALGRIAFLWKELCGGFVASNDTACGITFSIGEFDRSAEKTVFASQVLEEIGWGHNIAITILVNYDVGNSSS